MFDQSLLEKTTGQFKEDSIFPSSVSLSRFAKSGMRGSIRRLPPLLPLHGIPRRNTLTQSPQCTVDAQALRYVVNLLSGSVAGFQ